jgi:hypothetical protein
MATQGRLQLSEAIDEDRAIATITMAFSSDPVTRWVFRDANLYLTYWPRVVKAFGGAALETGTADSVDDYSGVALWLPPGVGSDEAMMGVLIAEAVAAADQPEVDDFMEQMGKFHPTESHWYLPLIGVDVTKQGRGTAPRCSAMDSNAVTGIDSPRTSRRGARSTRRCTNVTVLRKLE